MRGRREADASVDAATFARHADLMAELRDARSIAQVVERAAQERGARTRNTAEHEP